MGLLDRLPGWVQPYTPSHSIDWESVSMEHDSFLRFRDPLVAQEFTVYKQRDLIPTFIMMVFVIGGNFFMLTRVVWVPWILIPLCLIPTYGNLVCLISDTMTVFKQGKLPTITAQDAQDESGQEEVRKATEARRATLANRRYGITMVALLLFCFEVEQAARWGTYDKHCRQAPDWFAWFGFRTDPTTYLSPTEISHTCSQSPSPFHAMESSFAWSVLPVLPVHLIPVYLLGFPLRALAELYPRDVPWAFEDVATDTALQIFMMVLYVSLHAIRHRTSMNQFIQEINLRIATNQAERKEAEVDTLLCSMLPFSALERLSSNQPVADYSEHATVVFSDIREFTAWSSTRSAQEVVSMLNTLCLDFDLAAEKRKVEKVKTIGDGYWAVAGLPDRCYDHAERACNFGNAMLDIVVSKNKSHPMWKGIEVRIGVHTGPLHGGILGTSQLSYEVFGPTSTIAGKVEQAGVPGHVVVTEATLDYLEVPHDKWGEPYKTMQDDVLTVETEQKQSPKSVTVQSPTFDTEVEECGDDDEEKGGSHREEEPSAPKTIRLYIIPRTLNVVTAYSTIQGSERGAHTPVECFLSRQLSMNSTPKSSMASSVTSLTTTSLNNLKIDAGKKKRAEFMALRAAAKMEASGLNAESEETLEVIVARYSKRKYEYIFCEFADPAVESQFISYLTKEQSKLRIGCRLGVLGLLAIIVVSILTHSSRTVVLDGSSSIPAAFFLFPVAIVLGIADLALCFLMEKIFAPRAQAVLQIVTMVVLILGAGFMPRGSSYTTNDITYIFIILAPLLGFGNSGLVSAVSFVGTLGIVFVPLMMWLVWESVSLTMDFFFFMTMLMMVLPFIVITERVYRIQFLQFHTAEYFKQKQEWRTTEQEALLGSMVPAHIVKDLMVWMQSGMDPDQTIIQTLPVTATAFFQIDLSNREVNFKLDHSGSPPDLPSPLANSAANPLSNSGNPLKNMFVPQASTSIPITGAAAPSAGSAGISDLPEEPPEEEPLIMSNHWLQDIHERVDELLKPFASIVKIKTIGDVVMLAGPFTDKHDLATCCDEMLAAIHGIGRFAPVRAGLHCGELVAAVQGRSRLCFDIFGDTVNTASRVMASGSMGLISVSDEFYNALPGVSKQRKQQTTDENQAEEEDNEQKGDQSSCRWLTQGAVFTENPIKVAAKGKGVIHVRRFVSM